MPPVLDPLPPVTYAPGAAVPVSGRGIGAGQYAGINGEWSPIDTVSGGLAFALPDGVTAGPHDVRLGTSPGAHSAPTEIPGSGVQLLQVRPVIGKLTADEGTLYVEVSPEARTGQQAALSLASTDTTDTVSVVLTKTVTDPTAELAFQLPSGLSPGEYLAILTVDGVSTLVDYSHGRFSGPTVTVP
jgi:hypothetical protein